MYDLGGGTFDSAVVRNGKAGLEILGVPEGIEWLGGADFDQALADHVDRQLGGAVGALDPADPGTVPILAALRRDCMYAKEALSTREQAEIAVPLPGGTRRVTVTREAFEHMVTPALETTVEAFRRTLGAAGITPQDLTAVLLVGGSSQIPLVARLLRDALRRPIMINTHPKHSVALGAAMLSATADGTRASRRTGRGVPAAETAALAPVAGAANAAAPVARPAADTIPIPISRSRRRRTAARVLPAVAVVLGLLGVAVVFGPQALARWPLAAGHQETTANTGPVDLTSPGHQSRTTGSSSPSRPAASRTPSKNPTGPVVLAAGATGTIHSVATNLCVDSDTNPAMTLNGNPMGGHAFGGSCNGSVSQQWHEGPLLSQDSVTGTDWYRLLDEQTGFCLDSDSGGSIYTLPCLGADHYQIWQRVTPPAQPELALPAGTFVAYRDNATNLCVSIAPADQILRTLQCPIDNNWPRTMLFRRLK